MAMNKELVAALLAKRNGNLLDQPTSAAEILANDYRGAPEDADFWDRVLAGVKGLPSELLADYENDTMPPLFQSVKDTAGAIGDVVTGNMPKGKAPVSYVFEEGMRPMAAMAAQVAPGGSILDYFGLAPSLSGEDGYEPSFSETLKQGNYGDAAGKLWGTAGDIASLTPAGLISAIIASVGSDAARNFIEFAKQNPQMSVDDLWEAQRMFQTPGGNVFKEYPDTTSALLTEDTFHRAASDEGIPMRDLWPREDTLYQDVPAFGDVRVHAIYGPPNLGGMTSIEGDNIQINANPKGMGGIDNTLSHESTHSVNTLGIPGPTGANPDEFSRGSQYFNPQASDLAMSRGATDEFDAYQSDMGEGIARLAGYRKDIDNAYAAMGREGEVWGTNPLDYLDLPPSRYWINPDYAAGYEMAPQFEQFWSSGEVPGGLNRVDAEMRDWIAQNTPKPSGLDGLLTQLQDGRFSVTGDGPRLVGGTDTLDPEVAKIVRQMQQGNRDIQDFAQRTRPDIAENDNAPAGPGRMSLVDFDAAIKRQGMARNFKTALRDPVTGEIFASQAKRGPGSHFGIAMDLETKNGVFPEGFDEGFIDETGRFMSRQEAAQAINVPVDNRGLFNEHVNRIITQDLNPERLLSPEDLQKLKSRGLDENGRMSVYKQNIDRRGFEIVPDEDIGNYYRGLEGKNEVAGKIDKPETPKFEWEESDTPGVRFPKGGPRHDWAQVDTDPSAMRVDIDPNYDTGAIEKLNKLRKDDDVVRSLTDGLSDDDLARLSILTYHGTPDIREFQRFNADRFGSNDGLGEGWGVYSAENPAVAHWYRLNGDDRGGVAGRLYGLELPGEKVDYIQHDIPLAQQPPQVIEALKARGLNPEDYLSQGDSRGWYGDLARSFAKDITGSEAKREAQRMASEYLSQATGAKGFRYLDQGSRPQGSGVDLTVHDAKIRDIENAMARLPDGDPYRFTLESRLSNAKKDRMNAEIAMQERAKRPVTENFVSFNPDEVRVLGSTEGRDIDVKALFEELSKDPLSRASITMVNDSLSNAAKEVRKLSSGGDRFVGAPDGVNTPAKERALVSRLAQMATGDAALAGKDFYSDYGSEIRRNTNDPDVAKRLATITGHTSPQTTPAQNHNYAVKGLNQGTVGDQIDTGMFHNANRERIQKSLDSGRLPDDPKTGQYAYNIMPPDLRPDDFGDYAPLGRTDRPVHDTWDFRAFGYSNDSGGGGSLQRHAYMDRIYDQVIERLNADPKTRALAGPDGWNVENAQAAIWAAMRGEAMDAGAHAVNEVPDARGIFDQAKGFTQMAAIPGPTTGVDPALLNAPLDLKDAYTKTMFDALKDEDGASVIARSLGLSAPMREGYGPWQGMMEPNRVIDMGVAAEGYGDGSKVDPRTGKGSAPRAIDPSSDLVARTMRRWHQIALGQEGSGFTFPYDKKITAKNVDLAQVDAPLSTRADYERAFQAARKVWGDDFADKVVVQPGLNGGIMMKSITGDSPGFDANMKRFAAEIGAGSPTRMRDVGNQFDFVQWNDPSYRGLLDETRENPKLKAIFDEKIIPALDRVQGQSELWAREMGTDANTVPDRLRRIIVEAGPNWPAAIDAAVKKGIIPVVAGLIAVQMLRDQLGSDGGSQSKS